LNLIQCVDHHGWECGVDWMLSDSWAGFHEFAITGARPGLTYWGNVIHFRDICDSTSERAPD